MQTKLKDAIIAKIQNSTDEFQLHNFIVESFSEYIYGQDGEYLIGGEDVANFISDFIKLYC